MNVKIAGYNHPIYLSPKTSHFADLNILGFDFVNSYNLALGPNSRKGTADFYFGWGTKWETPKLKPKL